MTTTIKIQVLALISLFSLFFSLIPSMGALGQSKADINRSADLIQEYYYGPVKSGDGVFTLYNLPVDLVYDSEDEIGAAIAGGLFLSYGKAHKRDFIGVILINTVNEAIALTLENRDFKRFLDGKIGVDELLDLTVRFTFDLSEIPAFNANLLETR